MTTLPLDRTREFDSSQHDKTLVFTSLYGHLHTRCWGKDYLHLVLNGDPVTLKGCLALSAASNYVVTVPHQFGPLVQIDAYVPEETNLVINSPSQFQGSITAKHGLGNVVLHIQADNLVNLGHIHSLHATISDNGQITVEELETDLVASITGSGILKINSGVISTCQISANDQAKFIFPGKIEHAKLHACGHSHISIGHVRFFSSLHLEPPATMAISKH